VGYVPRMAGAIIILLAGWVFGRILGKGISRLLQRTGASDSLRRTVVGRVLERSGVTATRFIDLLIRWFVYLAAILAAVDVLKISPLSTFISSVVYYLPNLITGILILLFGLLIADFVGDAISAVGREAKIEFAPIISLGVKLFLYLTVIVIALTTMKIDVTILNEFAKAIAWGTAMGVGVGLGIALGWGLKDRVARDVDKWINSAETTAKKAENFWSWYTRTKEKEGAA
jgi:small-conductance mechanosensitive channel